MPELPEVETIRRGLAAKIVNKKIKEIWVEPSFEKKISPNLRGILLLKGKMVRQVNRRAKLLMFEFSKSLHLLIHLKMTGQLVYEPKKGKLVVGGHASIRASSRSGHPIKSELTLPNKFTRVSFKFSDGSFLFFNDVRKFGYFKIVDDVQLNMELQKYGKEPIDDEFTYAYFVSIMEKKPKAKIKVFLLEQSLIAGLGNIYADEVCFLSGVMPTRKVADLSDMEKKKIFRYCKSVLQTAILHGGTTFSNYVNSEGKTGGYQKKLFVYGREKGSCRKCRKGIIERMKIGGRSSSYCPICQK